ncbi:MAG TPA: S41 family peptidase [Desulfohalobiaceae bacterium]|nr:S41 family peptidase [Desulfohalobiaceae bacterium]
MRWSHYLGILVLMVCIMTSFEICKADNRYTPLKEFSQVLDLIEDSYVEDVQRDELVQGAIQGMLKSLDPHSAYMDKEDFKDMQVETTGEFSGVGIEITVQNGRLTVVSPIEGTPAYKAGIKSEDIILEVDGESTQDISIMDAVHKIRGPKGSQVELTVLHKGEQVPKKITVTREVIPVHSVKSEILEPGYLYIRVTNFNEKTTEELHNTFKNYQKDIKGIVFDLRNNPGGLLEQAVSVADTFLREGKIVYTKGKVTQSQMEFSAKKQESDIQVPMVVMINAGTASASEIVAGALKDHKRALIIGENSFGKGSVQTVIPLADGSGIKLTTALYYTPDGKSIQAEGINPDLYVQLLPSNLEKKKKSPFSVMREIDLQGHLKNTDNATVPIDKKEKKKIKLMLEKDNQLRLALQLVKNIDVIQALH